MDILKYKYKAHKFVNYAFYLIIFLIGFLIGFSTNKIDINKLISQFLMIDSVYAVEPISTTDYGDYILSEYAINYSDISVQPTSSTYYNEEYVYNLFKDVMRLSGLGYDFIDYSNVFISYRSSSYKSYKYYFSSSDFTGSTSNLFSYGPVVLFEITSNGFISLYTQTYDEGITSTNMSLYSGSLSNTVYSSTTSNISVTNVLNFSSFKLKFNKNLFKDNSNFKEVCVKNNKVFAITRSTSSEINEYFDYDYIWFPYGLDGLAKGLYDSSLEDKISFYTKQDTFGYYWFKNKKNIDNYFTTDIPRLEFEAKGYTDKYSYYGWSAHYFRMYFEGENTQFTIFEFKNPTQLTHNDKTNTDHGGGGLRLDFDNEVETFKDYCFYIKNEYEVQYLNIDEFNDVYGQIITPNGIIEISTSYNKNNLSSGGLMSQVNYFIKQIKGTIDFIRETVYDFYLSLPLLVRMFLISLFVILIVKFIIEMVVR